MLFRPQGEIPDTLYVLRPGDFSTFGLEMT